MKKAIFENYEFYEDGTVISLITGKHITKRINPKGYSMINLCINGKCKTFSFHRLIAKLFIPNPKKLPCVNHIDGNKLNNTLENLEWVTYRENIIHAFKNNLIHPAKGKSTKNGKFNDEDILKIRELYEKGISQYKIADLYHVTRGAIYQIVNNITYKHIT